MKIKTTLPFIFALSLYSCSQKKDLPCIRQDEIIKQNISALESFLAKYSKMVTINPEEYATEKKELSEEVKRLYWNLKGWAKNSLDNSVKYLMGEEEWE